MKYAKLLKNVFHRMRYKLKRTKERKNILNMCSNILNKEGIIYVYNKLKLFSKYISYSNNKSKSLTSVYSIRYKHYLAYYPLLCYKQFNA